MSERTKEVHSISAWWDKEQKKRQERLNQEVLVRLLNAIWMALKRGQLVTELGVVREHRENPFSESKFEKEASAACDKAVEVLRTWTFDVKKPSPQIIKKYEWIPDRKGDLSGGPGTRVLKIRASSLKRKDKQMILKIGNLHNQQRRVREKMDGEVENTKL